MDRLFAMQVFAEIVRRGSLTAAAAALGRAPPTVVRVLAALEAELHVKLLHRTTRRLSLTDEGRVYLAHCQRIHSELDEVARALRTREVEPVGTVSVTAPVRFGEMHVAPLVAGFLAAHARVDARLLLLDRPIDLLDEGIDVAVRIGRLRDSSLAARRVGEVRQVVVASPALLARVTAPDHPRGLAAVPCLRFGGLSSAAAWSFGRGASAIEVPVGARLDCNHAAATVQACVAGVGFGRFLSYQVMPEVRAGALRIVLADFEPPPLPVAVLYPPDRAPSARVRSLVDWLVAGLKSALAPSPQPPATPPPTERPPRGRKRLRVRTGRG